MCECPTMYDEQIVTARKPHRCCECGTVIVKGERYQSISGMWEGSFERFHTCMLCVDARQEATKGIPHYDCCDLPCLGELRQYLVDGFPDTRALYEPIHARFLLSRQTSQTVSDNPT